MVRIKSDRFMNMFWVSEFFQGEILSSQCLKLKAGGFSLTLPSPTGRGAQAARKKWGKRKSAFIRVPFFLGVPS